MKSYVGAIHAILDVERSALAKTIKAAIKEHAKLVVKNYEPRIGSWREATIDGNVVNISTFIQSTKDGDVVEVATRGDSVVYFDFNIPYVGVIKARHEKIQMGEYLLDISETYIKHPNLLR